jgi:hypothetical protein
MDDRKQRLVVDADGGQGQHETGPQASQSEIIAGAAAKSE